MSGNCGAPSPAASIMPNNSGSSSSSSNSCNNQINTVPAAKRRGLNAIVIPTCTAQTPITADLASLFECPVCFDYVLPPILQCQSGHLVCSNCRPKLTGCPTCRGPLGENRFSKTKLEIIFERWKKYSFCLGPSSIETSY